MHPYFPPLLVTTGRDPVVHVAVPHSIGELHNGGGTWMAVSSTAMTGYG